MDKKEILQILEQNKDKEFVKRIINPNKYPILNISNGYTASHLMAYGQYGDKYIVYPTVIYDGKELKQYDPDIAWEKVRKTGNYIEFDNEEKAKQFSIDYKKVWNE